MFRAMILDLSCLTCSYMVAKRDLMGFMEPTKCDFNREDDYADLAFTVDTHKGK